MSDSEQVDPRRYREIVDGRFSDYKACTEIFKVQHGA
jgi:hypothetical protein